MELLTPFVSVFALSFAIEGIVEYFFGKPLEKYAPEYSWMLIYVSFIVAIAGAWNYKLDLMSGWLHLSDGWTIYGIIISGSMIARGSNWLHGFWRRFLAKQIKQITDTDAGEHG